MTAATNAWSSAAERQPAVGFVDVVLRGAGQVMFQSNPLTGLLFIVGIAWGAAVAGMPAVAIGAVVGLVVSTVTAILLKVDDASLKAGLFGYNGILVGAAVPTFLQVEPLMWVYLVVGAAVSSVVLLAVGNVMKTFGAPALTFPFVLTTWFLLLGAYSFSGVPIASMGPPSIPSPIDAAAVTALQPQALLETVFVGISQVFLIDNVVTGLIFVLALAVSSPVVALFAVVGSTLALATSLVLGADTTSVSAGLFGFSAVLTAIALGTTFYSPGMRVVAYTLVGVIFTVIVQGALDVLLTPVGIPTLTAPFVFATWLFLLPKEDLAPLPHAPIGGGAATAGSKASS